MKILVLHGYTQNAEILRKKVYWLTGLKRLEYYKRHSDLEFSFRRGLPQLSAVRKNCKDCEFVFADGPMILAQSDMEGFQSTTTISELLDNANSSPELTPRAWWRANADRTLYDGVDQSILHLRDILAKQRFDGIFGFSQGASFAALMCAILERPHLYPSILVNGESPHPPMKFCVAVSGFKPTDANLAPLFNPPLLTPILHVQGSNDMIVTNERSQTLVNVFQNSRVERHDGGHFIPSKASWRNFFRDYFSSYGDGTTAKPDDVPSPTPFGTPAPSAITSPVDSRAVSPTPLAQIP